MKKLLRALLLIVGLCISTDGRALEYESFIVDGIGYEILSLDNRTVSVTSYAQKWTALAQASPRKKVQRKMQGCYVYTNITYSGKVVIPATVTYGGITYTVTEIGYNAFDESPLLTSLTIPNTVTYIDNCCMYYKSLRELIMEDGDTGLDWGADSSPFRGQPIETLYLGRNLLEGGNGDDIFGTSLKTLTIGDHVTSLYFRLCYDCKNLTSVHLGANVTSMGSQVFANCTSLTSINLSVCSKLSTISVNTFYGCTALNSVILPSGLTFIDDGAFIDCTSLKSIALPQGLTTIEWSAFEGSGLTSISLPSSLTSIGGYAFNNCAQLRDVIIEDGDTELGIDYDSSSPAFENSPIDSMYVGRNIVRLGDSSCSPDLNNTSLRALAFGDKVTKLGTWMNYTNLTSVYFGKNISILEEDAFSGCTSLKHIDMTSKLTAVPDGTFSNCTSLESVVFPANVTYLGGELFEGCTSLKSITIPRSVTEIGYSAFYGCTSLKDVVFEDGASNLVLEEYAVSSTFYQCPIDSVYLGRNLKTKENYYPLFPKSLTKLTIGSSVSKQWNYQTFQNCTGLTRIYPLWEQPITTKKNMFPNAVYSNATLLVPGGTVKKYQATAAWNQFANIVPTAIGVMMTATEGGTLRLGDEVVSGDTKLLQVKPNSVLTFEIEAEDEYYLESLTMNGEDVTAQIVDGKWTPVDLSEDLEVVATFVEKPYYNVTVTASAGGIAVVGSESVIWGSGTTVTLTANEGHELISVTVNGEDKTTDLVEGVLTLNDIKENKTVVATFQKFRYTVTASECENGSIQLSTTEVEWGDDATITLLPAAHYEVASVSVNGENCTALLEGNSLTINDIKQAVTIGATFRLQTFTVSATSNAGGSVQLSGNTAVWGSGVTVVIVPDDEHFLESLTVNGEDVTSDVTDGQYTITSVESDTEVTVTFAAKPYYDVTVTASAGGTALVGSESVMWGSGTTVTLTANEGHELTSVTVNGEDKTADLVDGVLTLNDIKENKTVVATFQKFRYTVTASECENGSIQLSSTTPEWGDNVTVTITPAAHYNINKVYVNGEDRTASLVGNVLTLQDVRGAMNVAATFCIQTFSVTASANMGGTIGLLADDSTDEVMSLTANWGSSVTVNVEADEDYELINLYVNGEDMKLQVENGSYTIAHVESEMTIEAVFKEIVEITLADGQNYSRNRNKHYETINFTRTFKNKNWQAWYVPFDVTLTSELMEHFAFAKFAGTYTEEDGSFYITVVRLKEGDVVKANTPYCVQAKVADNTNPQVITQTDVILEAAEENSFYVLSAEKKITFWGNYTRRAVTAEDQNLYALSGGKYSKQLVSNTLAPFRCFFTIEDREDNPYATTPNPSEVKLMVIGEETGIAEFPAHNSSSINHHSTFNGAVYDLNGRKVNTQQKNKGIYIINGKKVLVK